MYNISSKESNQVRNCNAEFKSVGLSEAYILVKGTISISGAGVDIAAQNVVARNKQVTFKNCTSFTNSRTEVNNTQVSNAKDIDVVTSMYYLTEYSNIYPKTSRRLWQFHKDDPNNIITHSESFKFKATITGRTTLSDNAKYAEIAVSFKYLWNF